MERMSEHTGLISSYQLLITAACTNTGGKMKESHHRAADWCPFVLRHSLSQVTSIMQLGMFCEVKPILVKGPWWIGLTMYMVNLFSCDQAALWMVFSIRTSVRLSVCLSICHTFFTMFPIIVSSRNFQEILPMTDVMPMLKVKVRGQRSRSQGSWPHLAISGQ